MDASHPIGGRVLEIIFSGAIIFVEADMKRILFRLFVLALAAVNWAALHDILKGERDVWREWSFVLGSVLLLSAYLFRKLNHAA
jgi:hypothetical protein